MDVVLVVEVDVSPTFSVKSDLNLVILLLLAGIGSIRIFSHLPLNNILHILLPMLSCLGSLMDFLHPIMVIAIPLTPGRDHNYSLVWLLIFLLLLVLCYPMHHLHAPPLGFQIKVLLSMLPVIHATYNN